MMMSVIQPAASDASLVTPFRAMAKALHVGVPRPHALTRCPPTLVLLLSALATAGLVTAEPAAANIGSITATSAARRVTAAGAAWSRDVRRAAADDACTATEALPTVVRPWGPQAVEGDGNFVMFVSEPADACSPVAPLPAAVAVGNCSTALPTALLVRLEHDYCSEETRARHAAESGASAVVFFEHREQINKWFVPGSHWMVYYDGSGDGYWGGEGYGDAPPAPIAAFSGMAAYDRHVNTKSKGADDGTGYTWRGVCNATQPVADCERDGRVVRLTAKADAWIRNSEKDASQYLYLFTIYSYFCWRVVRNYVLSTRQGLLRVDPRTLSLFFLGMYTVIMGVTQLVHYACLWGNDAGLCGERYLVYPDIDLPFNMLGRHSIRSVWVICPNLMLCAYLSVVLMIRNLSLGGKSLGRLKKDVFFHTSFDKRVFSFLILGTLFFGTGCVVYWTNRARFPFMKQFATINTFWYGGVSSGLSISFVFFGGKVLLMLTKAVKRSVRESGSKSSASKARSKQTMTIFKLVQKGCIGSLMGVVIAALLLMKVMHTPLGFFTINGFIKPTCEIVGAVFLERSISVAFRGKRVFGKDERKPMPKTVAMTSMAESAAVTELRSNQVMPSSVASAALAAGADSVVESGSPRRSSAGSGSFVSSAGVAASTALSSGPTASSGRITTKRSTENYTSPSVAATSIQCDSEAMSSVAMSST